MKKKDGNFGVEKYNKNFKKLLGGVQQFIRACREVIS